MSQRECWANVYMTDGTAHHGGLFRTRAYCDAVGKRSLIQDRRIAIIHIRLKPDGAPRRYASEHDRRNWETFPEEMRTCPF